MVGYGTQKKESVVGATSTASGEVIKQGVQGGIWELPLQVHYPDWQLSVQMAPAGKIWEQTKVNDDDYAYMYIRGQKHGTAPPFGSG